MTTNPYSPPDTAERRIKAALESFRDPRADRATGINTELTYPAVSPRWSVPVLNDQTWNELFDAASLDHRNSGLPLLPASVPCIAQNRVLLRTYSSLIALDLQSGKPAWECPALSGNSEPRQRAQSRVPTIPAHPP